jgi:tRNA dimethylallyltransferase
MKLPVEVLQRCWFLAGPTASGKSALALEMARRLGGEIVSMDSMAIYRRMDIGTAKPSLAERREVPHHLVDIVDPHEEYSAAQYLAAAEAACRGILQRDHVPLFVGGTGLYLRSLLRGVFAGPRADWSFRKCLAAEAVHRPDDWLARRLAEVDPESARRLHPRDTRRLIRALEIHHITGRPASQLQREIPLPPEARSAHVYWLHPPRSWLYARIDTRVNRMLEAGLVDEVKQLLAANLPLSRTASQALGYREVIDWLQGRIDTCDEMRERIQARTRQFAKRQHTWFRNLVECHEVRITGEDTIEALCERLTALASSNHARSWH